MAFVETVHATQGNDEHNGVGFYIDATDRTVWTRDMLYTLLSRVHHLSQLFLLGFDEEILWSLIMQSLPRVIHVDEWIFHNNVLNFAPTRVFSPNVSFFRPIDNVPYPMWLAYLIANSHGMTTIGSSNNQPRRLSEHNSMTHNKQPAIISAMPKGWKLYAWVGPFQNKQQAESFESVWKAQGNGQQIRNLAAHISSAHRVLGMHNYAPSTVHYTTLQ